MNAYKVAFILLILGLGLTILTYVMTPVNTSGWINLPDPGPALMVLVCSVAIPLLITVFHFLFRIWKKGDMTHRVIVYLILTALFLLFLYVWNQSLILDALT